MKPNSLSLLTELERELDHVHMEHTEAISYCGHALQLLHAKMGKLEGHLASHPFATKEQEAGFLAPIKSQFAILLLYYQAVSRIEHDKPPVGEKAVQKYYKSALEQLKESPGGNLDPSHDLTRHQFLALEDFRAARVPTGNLLRLYLEYELAKLDAGPASVPIPKEDLPGKINEGDTS